MRIRPKAKKTVISHPFDDFKEGYRYVFGFMPIRYCILILALMTLFGMQHATLMPIFAKDILHGGAHTLGFLVSASGIGALLSALYFAVRRSVVGLEKLTAGALALFGCANVVFSFSQHMGVSFFAMVVSGAGMMTVMLACNTIIQTVVEEDKRGRVMSLHAMASVGLYPFGSLIAGVAAAHLGAPHVVLVSGVCSVAAAFFFGREVSSVRTAVRPVYVARGIIKDKLGMAGSR